MSNIIFSNIILHHLVRQGFLLNLVV